MWLETIYQSVRGNSKCCSKCKDARDSTYFISLDGKKVIKYGYATCALCRIKHYNKKYGSNKEAIVIDGLFFEMK
jgi:hypothetical protein